MFLNFDSIVSALVENLDLWGQNWKMAVPPTALDDFAHTLTVSRMHKCFVATNGWPDSFIGACFYFTQIRLFLSQALIRVKYSGPHSIVPSAPRKHSCGSPYPTLAVTHRLQSCLCVLELQNHCFEAITIFRKPQRHHNVFNIMPILSIFRTNKPASFTCSEPASD